MRTPRTAPSGFTLIELVITMVLIAIFLMLAVPSLISFQRNANMGATANTLLAAINAARGEAMKRGMYAMVLPSDGTRWSNGWVVFVDMDRSQTYTPEHDITVLTGEAAQSYLTIAGTDGSALGSEPYVMYDASGFPRLKSGGFVASTLEIKRNDLADTESADQSRRIKTSVSGRTRVCTPATVTDLQCGPTG
jgi:type IV fimbrial biogenesis protein FimT